MIHLGQYILYSFAIKIEPTRRKFQHSQIDTSLHLYTFQHGNFSAEVVRFEHLGHHRNSNKKETANIKTSTQLRGLTTGFTNWLFSLLGSDWGGAGRNQTSLIPSYTQDSTGVTYFTYFEHLPLILKPTQPPFWATNATTSNVIYCNFYPIQIFLSFLTPGF